MLKLTFTAFAVTGTCAYFALAYVMQYVNVLLAALH